MESFDSYKLTFYTVKGLSIIFILALFFNTGIHIWDQFMDLNMEIVFVEDMDNEAEKNEKDQEEHKPVKHFPLQDFHFPIISFDEIVTYSYCKTIRISTLEIHTPPPELI